MIPLPETAEAAATVQPPQTRTYRLSDGHLVFPIWQTIRALVHKDMSTTVENVSLHLLQIEGCPSALLNRNGVEEALGMMTEDSLLLEETDDQEIATYSLPVKDNEHSRLLATNEIIASDSCSISRINCDPYCYECHRAGNVLSCSMCPRVFHANCVRHSDRIDVPMVLLRDPVPVGVEKTFLLTFDYPYGRIRQPDNATAVDDDPQALLQCIRCRLLARNGQHVRPSTTIDDLNEMLLFSFERVRTWISSDTFSAQEPTSLHIPDDYVHLLRPVLLQHPLTIADITARIAANGYNTLLEYQTDVMDVLHSIGVLRGTATSEYEAAKYMHLDVLHDITEISRCQDCYKHAIRRRTDGSWFVRPCTVPHPLVHAKLPGFSYWPAKVIRKLHPADGNNVQYDVRFFGGHHERALVAERFIVPDGRPIALRKTPGLAKALAELALYKKMLQMPEAMSDSDTRSTDEREAATTTVDPPGLTSSATDASASSGTLASVVTTMSVATETSSDSDATQATTATMASSDAPQKTKRVVKKRSKKFRIALPPAKRRRGIAVTTVGVASSSTDDGSSSMDVVSDQDVDTRDGIAIEASAGKLAGMPNGTNSDKLLLNNDDPLADSSSMPPVLDSQEPSQAQLVERLRRNMDGCPPYFVSIAESALREQFGINDELRLHYEKTISTTKSLQWCAVCLKQAMYYCCWRVSYCSSECQNTHWKTHENKCKRKYNSLTGKIDDDYSTVLVKQEQ